MDRDLCSRGFARAKTASGWANTSLASRLPRWIKIAKNRDEVLRALARLRAKLKPLADTTSAGKRASCASFANMTPLSLAVIGTTIVFTSFLSGVFGMAGGMILLGVLLIYFDVATAMVLFSVIQLACNAWRALQWRRFVLWPIFWQYVFGAIIAFALLRAIAFVPDKAMVYADLG